MSSRLTPFDFDFLIRFVVFTFIFRFFLFSLDFFLPCLTYALAPDTFTRVLQQMVSQILCKSFDQLNSFEFWDVRMRNVFAD